LQLSRANESGGFTVVHRTEHVRNNVNPVSSIFPDFRIFVKNTSCMLGAALIKDLLT
jgi:hypothetical protein